MQTESKIKKGFIRAFVVATGFAVALNVLAFSVSMREEQYDVGFGYLIIAAMLGGALYLLWYSRNRTEPYSWRSGRENADESSGDDEPSSTFGLAGEYRAPSGTALDADEPRPMRKSDWWRAEFDVDPLPDGVEDRGPGDRD